MQVSKPPSKKGSDKNEIASFFSHSTLLEIGESLKINPLVFSRFIQYPLKVESQMANEAKDNLVHDGSFELNIENFYEIEIKNINCAI